MTEVSNASAYKLNGWAQFIVTWLIAAIAAVLIAFGLVNLIKTVYKSSLPKYPIESFKYDEVSRPQPISEFGKEVKVPESTEEEKQKAKEREAEQRALAKINDYASSLGQLLAGLGLAVVFWLIRADTRLK